jgi:hypothetical protein
MIQVPQGIGAFIRLGKADLTEKKKRKAIEVCT